MKRGILSNSPSYSKYFLKNGTNILIFLFIFYIKKNIHIFFALKKYKWLDASEARQGHGKLQSSSHFTYYPLKMSFHGHNKYWTHAIAKYKPTSFQSNETNLYYI
jgi:hypothetical protein